MKTNAIVSRIFIVLVTAGCILIASCNPKSEPCPNEVIIGEFRDQTPVLTYKNKDKLKDALQLAFHPDAVIDSIFLHNGEDDAGEQVVILSAVASAYDSLYTSVNFIIRAQIGVPISWKPGDKPRRCTGFCLHTGEFSSCIGTIRDCTCLIGDRPCQYQNWSSTHPGNNIAEIIIPYLARD